MIIRKCDICNREVSILDTIVLYTKPIDYCCRCKEEAEKIKQEYKQEVEYENATLDSRLRSKERNIIHRIKLKRNRGIVIKE